MRDRDDDDDVSSDIPFVVDMTRIAVKLSLVCALPA